MLLRIERNQDLTHKVATLDALFHNLLNRGFLLLNFNLSLSSLAKTQEAKQWLPFHTYLLEAIAKTTRPQLILLGKIAERVLKIPASQQLPTFVAEHPYNLSFITNKNVQKFFAPFDLLLNDHA